jgi:hypothetical protein
LSQSSSGQPPAEAFQVGNVVRNTEDRQLGVIVAISRYSVTDPELYDLMVDSTDGVSLWPPESTVHAPDEHSRAEAIRLGLIALNRELDVLASFRAGNVVRNANGYGQVGVIRAVKRLRVAGPPHYVLIVDTADGLRNWPSATTVNATDDESRSEASRLGLLTD